MGEIPQSSTVKPIVIRKPECKIREKCGKCHHGIDHRRDHDEPVHILMNTEDDHHDNGRSQRVTEG